MRCKYCGSNVSERLDNCKNCGAPAVSFIKNRININIGSAPRKRKPKDYTVLNDKKEHSITKSIYLPRPPAEMKKYIVGLIMYLSLLIYSIAR